MTIRLLAFGKLADITGRSSWQLQEGVDSTDALRKLLEENYPALAGMHYQLAVDKTIITANTLLTDGAEVALLPPFSGG